MIAREVDPLDLLDAQVAPVRAERDALVAAEVEARPDRATTAPLLALKGIGPGFAGGLWSEGPLRRFDNRRQLAARAGLAPTPWQRAVHQPRAGGLQGRPSSPEGDARRDGVALAAPSARIGAGALVP